MNMIYTVFEYILCIIEIMMLHIFCSRLLEKKYAQKRLVVVRVLGCSLLVFFKEYLIANFGIGIIYTFSVILIYANLQFKGEWKQKIAYVSIFFLCLFLCDIVCTEVFCIIDGEVNILQFKEMNMLRYTIAMISKLVCFGMAVCLSSKDIIFTRKKEHIPQLSMSLLIVTTIISKMGIYGLYLISGYTINGGQEQKINFVVCVISLSIFLVDVIVYWAIHIINMNVQKEKEYQLIQYQNELLIRSTEESQAVENEWQRIRHDFNNHISCIDMLLQMNHVEKARHYIQRLTKLSELQTSDIGVGHTVADAIINQKMIKAKQYNIEMTVQGEFPTQFKIEDMDLCALLSNSLDNAIEATTKVEESNKQSIKLVVGEKVGNVYITVSNAVEANIPPDSMLKTTKNNNKRHGIGMRSMKLVLEKYNGYLNWSCADRIFTLTMVIPL
ncbi:MAG: GHKL domain-containing protein [Cellulosilyticum sp.]|nr:GHKL domain-containing protein [Cellulosilyticum sp.]